VIQRARHVPVQVGNRGNSRARAINSSGPLTCKNAVQCACTRSLLSSGSRVRILPGAPAQRRFERFARVSGEPNRERARPHGSCGSVPRRPLRRGSRAIERMWVWTVQFRDPALWLSRSPQPRAGSGTPDRKASRSLVSSSVSGAAVRITIFSSASPSVMTSQSTVIGPTAGCSMTLWPSRCALTAPEAHSSAKRWLPVVSTWIRLVRRLLFGKRPVARAGQTRWRLPSCRERARSRAIAIGVDRRH
jgi:hypothetical protein